MSFTVEEITRAAKPPDPMLRALDKEGITTDYLAKKLKEELDANEVRVFNGKDGIVYSDNLVAWDVRQKARIDAQKLMGVYPAEKHEHDVKGFTLNIKNA